MSDADTRAVRAGEELDADKLGAYLAGELGWSGPIAITQFPGGHSNLTYLVEHGGEQYVLRRPPFGTKVKTAHDMGREFRVLRALAPVYPKAPRPVLMCEDEAVIGARFYLMERRRGVILRRELPRGLSLDADTARRLSEGLVDALVELHAIDYAAAGLGDLGKPAGYVERQVRGWTERYEASRTDDIPSIPEVAAWLAAHLPAEIAPALIHNDFKFDNLIWSEDLTRVTGVLDWEMCTVGDPRMDLGTSLGYWVDADDPQPLQMMRFGPTMLPGMFARRDVAARYAEASGRDLADPVFFYVYGLFKNAVIAQQIYYRYAQGLTKDARFAMFIHGVRTLGDHARATIAAGRL